MSVVDRVLNGLGLRSTLANPTPELVEAFLGNPSYSGQSVTVDGSLRLVPVYSAVSLLAGAVASLPLVVYRDLGEDGRERARNHRTWPLLHDAPNSEMASDELWEIVTANLLLWGNAFLAKIRDSQGMVGELWPIRPDRVQVGRDEAGNRYFIISPETERRYTEHDILHIRGLGTDGLVGLSPIQQARQMLGGALAQEEFTNRFWSNSANPGGVLTHPNKLTPEAAMRLKDQWRSAVGGVLHAGETVVLEEGMEWKSVGMPLDDAQFLETAKFGDVRVSQLFRIPPRFLAAPSGDSLTYSSTEMQGIEFVTYSLNRWLVRIEKALLRDPSIFLQGSRFFPEFLRQALLQADTKTRFESYAIALDPAKGWMERDEVRAAENLPPSSGQIDEGATGAPATP